MMSFAVVQALLLLPISIESYARASSILTYRPDHGQGGSGNHSMALRCQRACEFLRAGKLFDVYDHNTTGYTLAKADYWSTFQSDVSPACFAKPTDAHQVAWIVQTARHFHCIFAVKSGGHAAYTGASNAPNGVTIELEKLDTITLSDDRQTASLGTGNVWITPYDYLTPMNLSVIGGRVTGIGVGGLTLGGGISYFSGRYGWACDNVRNYELVIANGSILQVNHTSYPDLYFALRGGGNNYGIVTRIDYETIPLTDMWGGTIQWSLDKRDEVISALYHQGLDHSEGDVQNLDDTMTWAVFVYVHSLNQTIIDSTITYAQPERFPLILANFTNIQPRLGKDTLRISNITDFARELNETNPNGLRETYWIYTIKLNEEMIQAAVSIFLDELESSGIKTVAGIVPSLVMQHIRTSTIRQMSKNGGNALGLDAEDGPLTMLQLSIWWEDESRDSDVMGFARRCVEKWKAKAEELGVDHRFLYQNYAAQEQDVFEGYGEESLERLRGISREWDPEGVWQRLQPGYFKL